MRITHFPVLVSWLFLYHYYYLPVLSSFFQFFPVIYRYSCSNVVQAPTTVRTFPAPATVPQFITLLLTYTLTDVPAKHLLLPRTNLTLPATYSELWLVI